ncbi:uncharacterized protein LOC129336462 [Eublepharis macularius]|uniref:Uncharacterized protein LOC129325482 n=1 Tax=Eublepharis macularius TaxID=481883 RepID=A0AA97LAL2_EUBMA|nr:uncharacterized protein LOC129325482 [Eublepharis macularius]XP_054845537.1 uncharacterized protein LOC129336462 [Eublepharis macularius]
MSLWKITQGVFLSRFRDKTEGQSLKTVEVTPHKSLGKITQGVFLSRFREKTEGQSLKTVEVTPHKSLGKITQGVFLSRFRDKTEGQRNSPLLIYVVWMNMIMVQRSNGSCTLLGGPPPFLPPQGTGVDMAVSGSIPSAILSAITPRNRSAMVWDNSVLAAEEQRGIPKVSNFCIAFHWRRLAAEDKTSGGHQKDHEDSACSSRSTTHTNFILCNDCNPDDLLISSPVAGTHVSTKMQCRWYNMTQP